MDAIGIIPARYASSRFQGKVLADILGKPMLQHVWEQAKKARLLNELVIACDDERVEEVAKGFAANVILTAKDHASGTDRLTEIVQPLDVKIIVNIQADEPLIRPTMIDKLASALLDNPECVMATLIKRIVNPEEVNNPNIVKVVIDRNNFALYFSRASIPYLRDSKNKNDAIYYKHIGLYAYTKDFLFTFKNLPQSNLEDMEKLEQLRVLQAGFKIKTVETEFETIGVDTPEDLEKVKKILKTAKL